MFSHFFVILPVLQGIVFFLLVRPPANTIMIMISFRFVDIHISQAPDL